MMPPSISNASCHLSEESLDDLLIGIGTTESEAHLATCSLCQAKVGEFRTNLKVFNEASLAWSESKSPIALRPVANSWEPKSLAFSLRWVAATCLLLLLGGSIWKYDHSQATDQNAALVSDHSDNSDHSDEEAQIAQDNLLLQSVDAALNDRDAYAISAYHLESTPRRHSKPPPPASRLP